MYAALKDAEVRKVTLDAELATAEAPAPRLLPNLAGLYRDRVSLLHEALEGEDAGTAREQVRALIDEGRLIPCPDDPEARLAVEPWGEFFSAAGFGMGSSEAASRALASRPGFGCRGHATNSIC